MDNVKGRGDPSVGKKTYGATGSGRWAAAVRGGRWLMAGAACADNRSQPPARPLDFEAY
jgi:hypothetical protein